MPFFILSVAVQVALGIHIVKSGRDTKWIWIVAMLPLAGALAYFFIEVLPDLQNSRAGLNAKRKMNKVIAPNQAFNSATRAYSQSDTVENSVRLGQECLNKGLYEEAESVFMRCLTGIHKTDPEVMSGLAQAQFGSKQYNEVKVTLDALIEANPDYKSQDSHLLYARTLDALEKNEEAIHEFETLHTYYSGPEADYYFALSLKRQGKVDECFELLNNTLSHAQNAGKHYKTLHSETLKKIKFALSNR